MASSALSPEQFSSLPDLLARKQSGAVRNGARTTTRVGKGLGALAPGGGGSAAAGGGSGGLIDAAADANGVFKITSLAAAL